MSARTSYVNPSPTITSAQISDATAFSRTLIQLAAPGQAIIGSNGDGDAQAIQGTSQFVGFDVGGVLTVLDAEQSATLIAEGTPPLDGTNPVTTDITTVNGIVTGAS